MSERSEKRIVVLRVGFLLFKIITLIGCYLLIRASNPENITYNWGQIIQLILGGPIVLLGILGILVFPIMLIRTEGGLTRKYLV